VTVCSASAQSAGVLADPEQIAAECEALAGDLLGAIK
jgi:hypothetical protein